MEEKMRKLVMIGFAWLLLMAGIAIPAMADVNVYADINKDKDIIVAEWLYKLKLVYLTVTVEATPIGAAESLALLNQEVNNMIVDQDPECPDLEGGLGDPIVENENLRTSTILGSINTNTGIVGVNQDSGNANNQGNAYAVAVTDVEAFAEAQASAEQDTNDNEVYIEGILDAENPELTAPHKKDLMTNSVWSNTGITSVNQSVGNMNNQGNLVAVAAGTVDPNVTAPQGVLVALAEADLGQATANNDVTEINSVKLDLILNSVNDNHGITNVNQSAGNMNNQANVVSLAFTH
jgi:hypothetical protein